MLIAAITTKSTKDTKDTKSSDVFVSPVSFVFFVVNDGRKVQESAPPVRAA